MKMIKIPGFEDREESKEEWKDRMKNRKEYLLTAALPYAEGACSRLSQTHEIKKEGIQAVITWLEESRKAFEEIERTLDPDESKAINSRINAVAIAFRKFNKQSEIVFLGGGPFAPYIASVLQDFKAAEALILSPFSANNINFALESNENIRKKLTELRAHIKELENINNGGEDKYITSLIIQLNTKLGSLWVQAGRREGDQLKAFNAPFY